MAFAPAAESLSQHEEVNMPQDEQLLNALTALKNGDFSVRLPTGQGGTNDEIAQTFNAMLDQLNIFSSEVIRVVSEVGVQGKLGPQADVPGAAGKWREMTENVNLLAGNLTGQLRDLARVCQSLADGKAPQLATVPTLGEMSGLKESINRLVQQNGAVQEHI